MAQSTDGLLDDDLGSYISGIYMLTADSIFSANCKEEAALSNDKADTDETSFMIAGRNEMALLQRLAEAHNILTIASKNSQPFWTLDAGRWTLDAGRWTRSAGPGYPPSRVIPRRFKGAPSLKAHDNFLPHTCGRQFIGGFPPDLSLPFLASGHNSSILHYKFNNKR